MIFPFLDIYSGSLSKRKLPLKCDEGYKTTYPETEKNTEKRKVNYDHIAEEVKTRRCCSGRCIQLILTVSDIYKTSEFFFEKSRQAQGQFLLNFVQVARRSKGQKTVYVHAIDKKYVCQKAWIFSHGR